MGSVLRRELLLKFQTPAGWLYPVVFFLMVLVFAVQGMSRLLRHSGPPLTAESVPTPQAAISPSVVAAISACSLRHRRSYVRTD